MLTDPVLLKTTPTVAVPELRVRLKVPWLLNVLPVPEFAIVPSFWISKLPEAWLLKMAPLAMVRVTAAPLIVAAPALLRVRPSRVLAAPERLSVPPDAIVVVPDPLIVPPVQVAAPLTVMLSEPERVPPDRLRVVSAIASPLVRFKVPRLTVRVVPSEVIVEAGAKLTVAPLTEVVPVTL